MLAGHVRIRVWSSKHFVAATFRMWSERWMTGLLASGIVLGVATIGTVFFGASRRS